MIKAATGETAIIGLSHENLKRLKQGKGIKFNMKDMGFEDREVFIVSGETEESIKKDFGLNKREYN